jgi:hypothetical protein
MAKLSFQYMVILWFCAHHVGREGLFQPIERLRRSIGVRRTAFVHLGQMISPHPSGPTISLFSKQSATGL